jgi:hypothetical protein
MATFAYEGAIAGGGDAAHAAGHIHIHDLAFLVQDLTGDGVSEEQPTLRIAHLVHAIGDRLIGKGRRGVDVVAPGPDHQV